MGIRIERGAKHVTISGVTSRKMWGDGFYVEDATDTKFCAVTADSNRRQKLSIVKADGVLVTDSVFKNTHRTRPSAGIDLERIMNRKGSPMFAFRIPNFSTMQARGSRSQASKKGAVAKVELARNVFRGNLPFSSRMLPPFLPRQSVAIGKSRLIQRVRKVPMPSLTQWMSSYTKMTARMVRICASK